MEVPPSELPPQYYPIDTPSGPDVDLSADAAPRIIAVSAFLVAISGVIVSLRFTARYLSTAGIWWDDWVCLAAMLVSWGCCICGFVVTSYNFGRHEAAQSLPDAVADTQQFFKIFYAYQTLYTIAITLAKISIIIFYGRIFTERYFRMVLWTVSGLVGVWYVAVQITQLVQCRPLHALWDGNYADQCIDLVTFFLAAGAVNCVLNFALLVMPLPMVWGLEIRSQAKLGLTATFGLGIFVFAVSVARLAVISRVKNVDVTWTYVDSAIWTTVEPVIAVCSASLPILRSLWLLLRPRGRTTQGTHMRGSGSRRYEKQTSLSETRTAARQEPETKSFRAEVWVPARAERTTRTSTSKALSPFRDDHPPSARYESVALTALNTVHEPVARNDYTDALSPISELSARKSMPFEEHSIMVPSNNVSRDPSAERSRLNLASLSQLVAGSAHTSGGASPATERSESPQTIELNRLPIQGAGFDSAFDGQPRFQQRGRMQDQYAVHRNQDGNHQTQRSRQVSASRRSSRAHGSSDHILRGDDESRAGRQWRNVDAVELDARENRRWSLRRGR